MKLERNEKVFYMRVSYDTIATAGTRTIQDVEQVGGYIYVTLDDNNYFQIRPLEKEFPVFHNSVGGIHEFMSEDTKEGRKLVKQTIQRLAETVLSQLGKLKEEKDNLMAVLDKFKIE